MDQSLFKSNFPEWYQQVIFNAELVDQSPTRGCFVIRPYGYALWENMQREMDRRIKLHGVDNAYFPLLIPESFLKKEAEHVEGFSPELAVVTHAGGKKLSEPYVVRPTSETIIYNMFARWINSWRDLPLKINQWANVVRWELRPRAFLRTAEFLWQEGHTAHATREEALETAEQMLTMYKEFSEEVLAIPVFTGEKTEHERFAGADKTLAVEAIMQDGKALQMMTSHLLAHSFPASFEVQFQDSQGVMQTPWCTSWGSTTRMIGAIIMTHGDERGLVMPPRIAPSQVVIIPLGSGELATKAVEEARKIEEELLQRGIRVKLDLTDKRPGAKYFHWELRGAPLRIELGMRDLEKGVVTVASRIALNGKEKHIIERANLGNLIPEMLESIHTSLFKRAESFRDELVCEAETIKKMEVELDSATKYFKSLWCGDAQCEATLRPLQLSIRCLLSSSQGNCFACGKMADKNVLIAKSY